MTVGDQRTQFTPSRSLWTGAGLSEARSLTADSYTSESVFRAEMERIHLRGWILLGRVDEWTEPGFYRALDTVGGPVLVVRDEANVLRAFANTCRHRGALLVDGCGVERRLLCPYHAWSYRLDGKLLAAPFMEETIGFKKEDWSLMSLRLETWAGFVFINYADDAPTLADDMGDLADLLASHAMDDMVCTWRTDFEARCNWKLLVENAMETYHTATVHAATVGSQTSVSYSGRGEWMGMQVLSKNSIAVLHGEPPFKPIAGLSDQAREGTFFVFLHPTTQLCCAQDCMWWLTVRPTAADRTVVSIGGCFPNSTAAQENFHADAAAYYKRWEMVALEDIAVLEKLQTAIVSRRFQPGPLSWRDDLVHTFDEWVLKRLIAETHAT